MVNENELLLNDKECKYIEHLKKKQPEKR